MESIFNKNSFEKEQPFLEAIFKKGFDAFFFLHYPKPNDFDGVHSHNPPCFFLNNIKQRKIYISNVGDSKKLHYEFTLNYWEDRADCAKSFNVEFNKERYLFWHSEHENWAMITDANTEFALLATDWKIADQVILFYQSFLISPKKAIEKLQVQAFKEDFLVRYQPNEVFAKGNNENQIWTKYIFDCHVEKENDKIFYWQQFEPLFHSLTKVLKGLKGIDMYAEQAFWRKYYSSKQWYTTGKNAPVGGWQAFTHKNCLKVATKFLTDNLHLQLQFEGQHDEADKLIRQSKNGLISFSNFWIYANSEKKAKRGYSSDFYFKVSGHGGEKKDAINQQFEFYLNETLIEAKKIEVLIDELMEIGFVKKVYQLRKPYVFARYNLENPLAIITMNNYTINYDDLELYKERID